MTSRAEPVEVDRASFEANWLMQHHPPVWAHPHKRLVFELACPEGTTFAGSMEYSKWAPSSILEMKIRVDWSVLEARPDVYDYQPVQGSSDALEWHVNFADPELFVAYWSGLLAQDELQVAEHPALGALAEALRSRDMPVRTVDDRMPTPVLIRGVERRCRIATDPNPAEGRPLGLYGNRFAAARDDAIRRATVRIDPPTITNVVAMAAPTGGFGTYEPDEIEFSLLTAFTAFRASVLESYGKPTVIHTGFWGCGVFGGNRHLMTILQLLAANMSGVDRLIVHTFDRSGMQDVVRAKQIWDELAENVGAEMTVERLIDALMALKLEWGVGDGN